MRQPNITFISSLETNRSSDFDEDDFQFYIEHFKREFEQMQTIDSWIEASCLPAVIVGGIILGKES